MAATQNRDMGSGSIPKLLAQLALPAVVAQVVNLLYNIVDRIYIARIPDIGTAALGAVGLCFPIIVIITAFSNLFGSGGAPLFAIARGSGDKTRAGLILNLACTLLLCCAGVLMVIGLLFARPILVLFGASPEALQYALPYLMLYLLGTYPSMLTTGLNPFINAQGYATAGMLSVVIGAAANLVLDPVFIFVLGMGICGAAAATVLSQLLSAAFVVYFLRCKSEYRVQPLPLRQLPANRRCIGDIVSLGTAGFIMQLTNSVVTICCNNVLSVTGGDVYISVMTIISSVRQMVETPIYAITEGSSPIISYNYGARNAERVKGAFKLLLKVSLTYSVLIWLFVELVPQAFAGMFTADAELLAFTSRALRIYMGCIFMFGIQIACQMTFTSIGFAKESIVVAVTRKFILLLPLIYILPHVLAGNQTMAVYTAEPVADFLAVSFTILLFRRQFKKALSTLV